MNIYIYIYIRIYICVYLDRFMNAGGGGGVCETTGKISTLIRPRNECFSYLMPSVLLLFIPSSRYLAAHDVTGIPLACGHVHHPREQLRFSLPWVFKEALLAHVVFLLYQGLFLPLCSQAYFFCLPLLISGFSMFFYAGEGRKRMVEKTQRERLGRNEVLSGFLLAVISLRM